MTRRDDKATVWLVVLWIMANAVSYYKVTRSDHVFSRLSPVDPIMLGYEHCHFNISHWKYTVLYDFQGA